MDSDQELKSLKRGLQALIMLTRQRTITVSEAARQLDLPRTTAERIMLTLESERFIERDPRSKRFSLAPRVMALGGGFSDEDRLVHVAEPLLFEKTRDVGWPMAIAVALGENMAVRLTTDTATSLGLHRRHVGSEIAMAASSSGIVHLAFLEGAEREELIGLLARSENPNQALARNRPALNAALAETRRNGFSMSPDFGAERSVSVPLRDGSRVRAVLLMMYIARGMRTDTVVSRYVPQMKALATAIEAAVFSDQGHRTPQDKSQDSA